MWFLVKMWPWRCKHGEWNCDTSKTSKALFCVCRFFAQVQTMPLIRSQGSTFFTNAEQIPPGAFFQTLHAFELHLREVASMIQKLPSISLHAGPALSLKCCKRFPMAAIGIHRIRLRVSGSGRGAYVSKMPLPLLKATWSTVTWPKMCFKHV